MNIIYWFSEQNDSELQSTIKSKPENLDSELKKINQEENQLRKLSDTHVAKSLRPKSSRPPAPNRRPQSNTYTE
jgi:hypothetical protein